jgi:acyl carrier protein
MDHATVEKEITSIVAEVTEMTDEEVWEKREEDYFNDIGLDSLLALEILAMIEKKYKVQIPEEKLADMTSLQQTIDISKKVLIQDGKLAA